MLGRTARRWTAVVVLSVAGLALGASGTSPGRGASGTGNAAGDRITLAQVLLEGSIVALKPQGPSVAWLDRVSSKPDFTAGAVLVAGVAAGLAVPWLLASVARGRPALQVRRYSLALRAPPALRLS